MWNSLRSVLAASSWFPLSDQIDLARKFEFAWVREQFLILRRHVGFAVCGGGKVGTLASVSPGAHTPRSIFYHVPNRSELTTMSGQSMRFLAFALVASASISSSFAQFTSVISGRILDEEGNPVQSTVFATAGPQTIQTLTATGGRFVFANLRPGTYVLCASPTYPLWDDPVSKGPKRTEFFLDSCQALGALPTSVGIGKGQSAATVLTLRRGRAFEVRMRDPQKLLTGKTEGADPKQDVHVFLTSPNGLISRMPITSRDSAGRSHRVVLPYNAKFRLSITANSHVVRDEKNADAAQSAEPIIITKTSVPPTRVITIVGRKNQ